MLLLPVNEKLVEANLDKPATNLPFPGHKKPRTEPNWAKRLSRFHRFVNRFLLHIGIVSTFENCTPTLTRLSEVFGLDLLRFGS